MNNLNIILRVKENEEFNFDGGKEIFKIKDNIRFKKDESTPYVSWSICENEKELCEMIKFPEKINIINPRLSETEITIIKGRIAEGYRWIVRDGTGFLDTYKKQPRFNEAFSSFEDNEIESSNVNEDFFKFIKKGQCYNLVDLIKGVDNNNDFCEKLLLNR